MEAHVRVKQWFVGIATAAALVAALPAVAHAGIDRVGDETGSVGVEGDGTLYFSESFSTDNNIVIELDSSGQFVLVSDTADSIFPYPGCSDVTAHQVRCG